VGRYLHTNYKEDINKVMQVPTALREQWGVYKTCLTGYNGYNHGKKIRKTASPITVYENCQSIHSVRFEKNGGSHDNPLKKNVPVAIHTAKEQIYPPKRKFDTLLKRNLLKRPLVGIHGVAMNKEQASSFKALVWCPESMIFCLTQPPH